MEKGTLQTIRRTAPGIFGAIAAASIVLPSYTPTMGWSDLQAWASGGLIALFFGVAYRGSGLQERVHNFIWRHTVDTNLRVRLLDLVDPRQLPLERRRALAGDRRLLQVFYHFVDHDDSLKNKVQDVYENGAYLGTAADLAFVAAAAVPVQGALGFAGREWAWTWVLIYGALFLACSIYIPFGIRRHLELADEQLDYIRVHLQGSVADKLLGLADPTPPPSPQE